MPSRKSHIQLYADECFPIPFVTYLRSLGYSIIHAFDKKYIGKSDKQHFTLSKKLQRALITLDRDFTYYEDVQHDISPGVIVVSVGSATPIHVNKVYDKFLKTIREDFVRDSLVTITKDKITKVKRGKIVYEKEY